MMVSMNRYAALIGFSIFLTYLGLSWFWREAPDLNMLSVNILQSVAALYAAVMMLLVYRQTKLIYWLYYFFGTLCYFLAQIYWTCYYIRYMNEPDAIGLPEILWMIQYAFYIMALYNHNKTNIKLPAVRFILDILLFFTVSATLYWRHFIEPLVREELISSEEVWFNLFCSSANAVILFGLFVLFIYERISMGARAFLCIFLGFLLKSSGNTAALYLYNNPSWVESIGFLPDLCWFAGLMMLGFSAVAYNRKEQGDRSLQALSARGYYFFRRKIPLVIIGLMLLAFLLCTEQISATMIGLGVSFNLLIFRLFVGIHDYKMADEALQESVHNYRNLVENSLVGVFIEQDGRVVYVNRYCEELFGYEPGEMIGKPMAYYAAERERHRFQDELAKLDGRGFTPRLCFECRRKDQSVIYTDLQAATTIYQGRKAISGTLLDISESKRSEQMLIRSEKLSVVGQLAAGVAHEIRNPLTALKGFTQLLYEKSDQNKQYYDIMLTELERINYIVGEFMVLSKPNHWLKLYAHDLQDILKGIIPIIDSQAILHNISIHIENNANLPQVRCDQNQIKQVFLNILKNAIEAMPSGGNIWIQFEPGAQDQVTVTITDEGSGIPGHILNRIGEPFFSTKETGTGLGLMVCNKIIQTHGGSLVISNNSDQGTVVRIGLPAAE